MRCLLYSAIHNSNSFQRRLNFIYKILPLEPVFSCLFRTKAPDVLFFPFSQIFRQKWRAWDSAFLKRIICEASFRWVKHFVKKWGSHQFLCWVFPYHKKFWIHYLNFLEVICLFLLFFSFFSARRTLDQNFCKNLLIKAEKTINLRFLKPGVTALLNLKGLSDLNNLKHTNEGNFFLSLQPYNLLDTGGPKILCMGV